jgi:hypothetical protein
VQKTVMYGALGVGVAEDRHRNRRRNACIVGGGWERIPEKELCMQFVICFPMTKIYFMYFGDPATSAALR